MKPAQPNPAGAADGLGPAAGAAPGEREAEGRLKEAKTGGGFSALQIALFLSIGVHAALLTLRFAAPATFDRVFNESPLEVILVNTKSTAEAPDKPRAIAQATLAGGGSRDDDKAQLSRPTSPLPPAPRANSGEAALDVTPRNDVPLPDERRLLLAQIEQRIAQLRSAEPQPERIASDNEPQPEAPEEQRRRLIMLMAEIERSLNEDSAGPKRRYVSPATREAVYALYYDGLRRRIEEKGTLNFPQAGGKKLYGELTMLITVDSRGKVLATDVAQSSGSSILDRRAEAIVRAAGPFDAFDDAMRAKGEQILVESRFRFKRDETLEAKTR